MLLLYFITFHSFRSLNYRNYSFTVCISSELFHNYFIRVQVERKIPCDNSTFLVTHAYQNTSSRFYSIMCVYCYKRLCVLKHQHIFPLNIPSAFLSFPTQVKLSQRLARKMLPTIVQKTCFMRFYLEKLIIRQ